jgi:Na+-translocating ferredoxin:NAD+ oxidoreductase subunit B
MIGLVTILALGATGAVIGYLLAVSAEKFHVEVDPLLEALEDALPAANCGACGYPGCAGCAEGMFSGEASVDACPVGGEETAAAVAKLLGKDEVVGNRVVATIRCKGMGGKEEKAKYEYIGLESCKSAHNLSGGWTACDYGCLKLGDCSRACNFESLFAKDDGTPYVIEDMCTACNYCVEACPRDIIELVPAREKTVVVECVSKDKPGIVRKVCSTGCIACSLCVKACDDDAITVENFLAHIDQDKCTSCEACVAVCPTKVIEVGDFAGERKVSVKNDESCVGCDVCH